MTARQLLQNNWRRNRAELSFVWLPAAQRCRCLPSLRGFTFGCVSLHVQLVHADICRILEEDCDTIGLPEGWKYLVNCDGIGRKLAFPVLLKQSAHFSQMNFKRTECGDLEGLPRHPCEKITIRCATQACSI